MSSHRLLVSDQIPALPISRKLIEAFKTKATIDQVEEILSQIPGPKKDDQSGESKYRIKLFGLLRYTYHPHHSLIHTHPVLLLSLVTIVE